MEKNLNIYYRTCSEKNTALRPYWYSKELCLLSFINNFSLIQGIIGINFMLIHDGPMKNNPEWATKLKKIIEPIGVIVEKPKQGNSASCKQTIEESITLPREEIVVFVEDDYLWLNKALLGIVNAIEKLPVDYITPYDHPVRYQKDYPQLVQPDYCHHYPNIHLTSEAHWRAQESTTMTFAARVETIKQDLCYFEIYSDNGKGSPNDRELFRHLQGLGPYENKFSPNRILMGPMPSLATHVHLPWLAPNIQWEDFAKNIIAKNI